ncbi:MAG: hypothetical protein AB1486_35325, partial [Planctomycetota bacterium]
MADAGDIDGDSVSDILVGAGALGCREPNYDFGYVSIFRGSNGERIYDGIVGRVQKEEARALVQECGDLALVEGEVGKAERAVPDDRAAHDTASRVARERRSRHYALGPDRGGPRPNPRSSDGPQPPPSAGAIAASPGQVEHAEASARPPPEPRPVRLQKRRLMR